MSVRIMSAVWQLDLPDSEKLVLLALADCSNDEGFCWPSMRTLAGKCSKSDRTVQASIKELVKRGHLTRIEKPGKGCEYYVHPARESGMEGTNPHATHYTYRITATETGEFYVGARSCYGEPASDTYMGSGRWIKEAKASGLNLEKVVIATYPSREALAVAEQELSKRAISSPLCRNGRVASARGLSPFGGLGPEGASPRSGFAPQPTAQTPEAASDKPSRTTIPKKDKPSLDMRASKFALPDRIPAQPWADFEDMRRRIGKPMTQRAKELAVMRLDKLAEDGWPPGDVLNHSTLNSYQGLFPPKDDRHGRQQQPQSLRGTRPDPALDMLRQAQAELAASSYQDPDRPAWPSLPSFGSG